MEQDMSIEPIIIDANDNPEEAVREIFKQSIVMAAQTIVSTARGGIEVQERLPNGAVKSYMKTPSRLEYDAARYIIEYEMGKGKAAVKDEDESPEDVVEKWRREILGIRRSEDEGYK